MGGPSHEGPPWSVLPPRQLPILDPVRLVGVDAEAAARVGVIVLRSSLKWFTESER